MVSTVTSVWLYHCHEVCGQWTGCSNFSWQRSSSTCINSIEPTTASQIGSAGSRVNCASMTPERLFFGLIFPLLALYLAISLYSNGALCYLSRFCGPQSNRLEIRTPHQASWITWFHPLQDTTEYQSEGEPNNWNLFHHLGGYGPWIEKSGTEGEVSSLAPPDGCRIDQVHMVGTYLQCWSIALSNIEEDVATCRKVSHSICRNTYVTSSVNWSNMPLTSMQQATLHSSNVSMHSKSP